MNGITTIAKNLSLHLGGKILLDNISFELENGSHLLLTGPSGSGKTLLTKAIAGQLFHEGSICFLENGLSISPSVLRVEQHYHFTNLAHINQFYYQQRFNSMDADDAATVSEELQAFNPAPDKLAALLSIFGLEDRLQSPLLHLSSGEHKRFQLIRAFLQEPQIMILDEPFTGMDKRSRELLRSYMTERAEEGCQFIVICDQIDCPGFINTIAVLKEGKLEAFGKRSPESINQAATLFPNNPGAGAIPLPAPPLPFLFSQIIEMNQAGIRYGNKTILEAVQWTVLNGERWWLKGANGSGKSTLLSLVTADNPKAYSNDLWLFGRKRGTGESIWDIKKNIGYVSPELQWYFDNSQTCYNAVASGLFDTIGLFRQLSERQHQQVMHWLEAFGLTAFRFKLLSLLSTSQQRLTLLARAMVKNPPLLILDEPCQGLDETQRDHFTGIVDMLCEDENRTLIYVTHYEEELPACINRKIELENGRAKTGTYYSEKLLSA